MPREARWSPEGWRWSPAVQVRSGLNGLRPETYWEPSVKEHAPSLRIESAYHALRDTILVLGVWGRRLVGDTTGGEDL